ncbi:TPA: hypothetical protein CPU00_10780 [Candidatus Gastranaerophilales bacterium HUM_18]|nr:MAG TPA: hypothetical protein CPU00_10780 [Candidatus Gastranaerophilales bacterium HUM_18]
MILTSKYSNPQSSIYYLSAQILSTLKGGRSNTNVVDFFIYLKTYVNKNFTYANYIMTLDWLFILNAITIQENRIVLCTSKN